LYALLFEFVFLFAFEEKEKSDPLIEDPLDFVELYPVDEDPPQVLDELLEIVEELPPVNEDPLEIVEVLPPVKEDPLDFVDDPLVIVEVLPPVKEDPLDFVDDTVVTIFPFVGELIVGAVTRLDLRLEEIFVVKVVLECNKKEVLELEQFLH